MKKLVSLLVVLMLLLSCSVSFAETPSKTTDDMTYVEHEEEGLVVYLETNLEDPTYSKHVEAYTKEIANLAAAEKVEDYFGEESAAVLNEVLGEGPYTVHEFAPLIVANYEETKHGDVTLRFNFATPYPKNQKVVVMIGFVTVNPDGTETVEWVPFEGFVVEDGCVELALDPQTMMNIQQGVTLMAIVSK